MVAKAQMCTGARIHAIRHLDYLEDPEGEVMHDLATWQANGYMVDYDEEPLYRAILLR